MRPPDETGGQGPRDLHRSQWRSPVGPTGSTSPGLLSSVVLETCLYICGTSLTGTRLLWWSLQASSFCFGNTGARGRRRHGGSNADAIHYGGLRHLRPAAAGLGRHRPLPRLLRWAAADHAGEDGGSWSCCVVRSLPVTTPPVLRSS